MIKSVLIISQVTNPFLTLKGGTSGGQSDLCATHVPPHLAHTE